MFMFFNEQQETTTMEKDSSASQKNSKSRALAGGWVISSHNGTDVVGIVQSISTSGVSFHHASRADCTKLATISIYLESPIAFALKDFPCRMVSDRIQSVVGNTTLRLCKVQFGALSSEQKSQLKRLLG